MTSTVECIPFEDFHQWKCPLLPVPSATTDRLYSFLGWNQAWGRWHGCMGVSQEIVLLPSSQKHLGTRNRFPVLAVEVGCWFLLARASMPSPLQGWSWLWSNVRVGNCIEGSCLKEFSIEKFCLCPWDAYWSRLRFEFRLAWMSLCELRQKLL